MTPAKKSQPSAPVTEPAAAPDDPTKAALHALLQSLGYESASGVASIEVSPGRIRVIAKDRSLRSYRIDGIA